MSGMIIIGIIVLAAIVAIIYFLTKAILSFLIKSLISLLKIIVIPLTVIVFIYTTYLVMTNISYDSMIYIIGLVFEFAEYIIKSIFLLPLAIIPIKGEIYLFEIGIYSFPAYIVYYLFIFQYFLISEKNLNYLKSKTYKTVCVLSFVFNSFVVFILLSIKCHAFKYISPFLDFILPQMIVNLIDLALKGAIDLQILTLCLMLGVPLFSLYLAFKLKFGDDGNIIWEEGVLDSQDDLEPSRRVGEVTDL